MKNKDDRAKEIAELRRRAEEMAREKAAQLPENLEALSPEATRRTLHELHVPQIELEMQNEELPRTPYGPKTQIPAVLGHLRDRTEAAYEGHTIQVGLGKALSGVETVRRRSTQLGCSFRVVPTES